MCRQGTSRRAAVPVTLALALALLARATALAEELVVAAGPAGSAALELAAAIAGPLHDADLTVRVAETQGAVENVLALSRSEADLGLLQMDAFALMAAKPEMAEVLAKVRFIYPLSQDEIHVIVRRDSGVSRLEDFAGKRVAIGEEASGSAVSAALVLQAVGLEPGPEKFRKLDRSEPAEALEDLLDGDLDAMILVGAAPVSMLSALAPERASHITLLPLSSAVRARLTETKAPFSEAVIGPTDYAWLDAEIPTAKISTILIGRRELEPSTVRRIAAAIAGASEHLEAAHRKWGQTTPTLARTLARQARPMFHDGALLFLEGDESAAAGDAAGAAATPPVEEPAGLGKRPLAVTLNWDWEGDLERYTVLAVLPVGKAGGRRPELEAVADELRAVVGHDYPSLFREVIADTRKGREVFVVRWHEVSSVQTDFTAFNPLFPDARDELRCELEIVNGERDDIADVELTVSGTWPTARDRVLRRSRELPAGFARAAATALADEIAGKLGTPALRPRPPAQASSEAAATPRSPSWQPTTAKRFRIWHPAAWRATCSTAGDRDVCVLMPDAAPALHARPRLVVRRERARYSAYQMQRQRGFRDDGLDYAASRANDLGWDFLGVVFAELDEAIRHGAWGSRADYLNAISARAEDPVRGASLVAMVHVFVLDDDLFYIGMGFDEHVTPVESQAELVEIWDRLELAESHLFSTKWRTRSQRWPVAPLPPPMPTPRPTEMWPLGNPLLSWPIPAR
ncbi:MAG: TAXI family TRAP transporter solute-binding subunit [Candidatus Schekmanbacteria bacterium]|nr:TAXI family TRAP transporter solute-binding subunit [Candidatus Schekmanbacteria bacterium]